MYLAPMLRHGLFCRPRVESWRQNTPESAEYKRGLKFFSTEFVVKLRFQSPLYGFCFKLLKRETLLPKLPLTGRSALIQSKAHHTLNSLGGGLFKKTARDSLIY